MSLPERDRAALVVVDVQEGFWPYESFAADAVGSRHAIDCERALPRTEQAGAVVTTVEAALLESCERAGTPEFKAVQKVIL